MEDIKENKNGKFITLTFNNESYKALYEEVTAKKEGLNPYAIDNAIATLAVRRFTERWRKEHKKTIRHWLITELGHGRTEHIHLHGIVWADDVIKVEQHWKYGYIWKGKFKSNGTIENYVNAKTINYMTKYMLKTDIQHREYNSLILCSKGIGKVYLNSSRKENIPIS